MILLRLLPLIAVLSGCAYAPGFYSADSTSGPEARFKASAVIGHTAQDNADAPPAGALISITPELLRQQRASQPTDILTPIKPFGLDK